MTTRDPLLVGLTGGLASGKSTVARMMSDAGCRVVDADSLVAELYASGEPGAEAVADLFGAGMIDGGGAVDHRKLASRVFDDPDARHRLEERVHPLVRHRFTETAAEALEPIVVLEATLLVEAGFGPDFDLVVTVEADPEVRLKRAIARGLTREDAEARLEAQGDGASRRAGSQRVIENDGTLAELQGEVQRLVADLTRLSSRKPPSGETA